MTAPLLHVQQQVLNALQALLIAAATDAGERVYVDRVDSLKPAQLPAILIGEGDNGEDSQQYTVRTHEQRTLEVVIDCAVKHCSTAAADARALGLVVEKAVRPSSAMRALCQLGVRIVNSRLVQSGDGDNVYAARRQTWNFIYLVNASTPDVVADQPKETP